MTITVKALKNTETIDELIEDSLNLEDYNPTKKKKTMELDVSSTSLTNELSKKFSAILGGQTKAANIPHAKPKETDEHKSTKINESHHEDDQMHLDDGSNHSVHTFDSHVSENHDASHISENHDASHHSEHHNTSHHSDHDDIAPLLDNNELNHSHLSDHNHHSEHNNSEHASNNHEIEMDKHFDEDAIDDQQGIYILFIFN